MLEELPLDRTTTGASSRPSIHHHPTPQTEPPLSIPDGGYGWVCTICVAVINGHSWGINTAYGVFLAHYISDQTFPGASRLEYALVGSLIIGCTLLISPLVTIIVREFGTKSTMLCGALIQSISLICASLATKIWHLFLTQGILFGIGMGLLFLPSVGLVAQWFTKRLALASGITNAGAGLGGLTYSLCTGAMIQNLGLIWTLRILSLVTFIINVTFTVLIKDRYETLAPLQLAFDVSLFRRTEYILMLAFGAFSMLGYFVLIFTLANYANEIGLDASEAAIVSAMFSLGQTVGRPVLGHLGDSLGRINMATFMTLLAGILSLTIWVNAKTYGVLLLFSLLGGIPAGTFWISASPILAEVIGLENLPSGLSILWLVLVLPSTFSSPIALQIFSQTGSYIGAQLFTGLAFIAAGVCMGLLRGWAITRAKSLMSSSAVQANSQTEFDGPSHNRLGHVNIRSTVTNSIKWANV